MKQSLWEHKVAILLAVAASLLVVAPQLYFRIEHRSDGIYKGIELMPNSPWTARVREIQDGHGFGSIYYKDGKNDPYLLQPLGSMTVAYMGKIFDLDINNTILLSRFILPFITFLLLYTFIFLYSRDNLLALSGPSLILIGESLLSFYGIPKLLSGISPSSFIEISRPVNSAMTLILFYGFLMAFWKYYQNKGRMWGILSALILGLNFYNYFYTWTYLYAFGGILILIFIIMKQWREAVRLSYVFLGGFLIAVPYLINLYQATHYPTYQEVGQRFGLVATHAPVFIGWIVLVSIIVFLIRFPRQDWEKYYFGLALLLAPIVTLNQQLITGRVLQEGHYHWYFHKPMAVIFILLVIFYTLLKYRWYSSRRILAIFIIVLSFAAGTFVQGWSYYVDYPGKDGGIKAIERQRYGPVMDWLNENAEKESVVLGNNETSNIVVTYTSSNVFYHHVGHISLVATKERVLNQLFTFYRLEGVGEKDVREIFYKDRGFISPEVYGTYYRDTTESYGGIPNEVLDEIIATFEATLKTPTALWLHGILLKYEVEYIVWDKAKDPLWQLDKYKFLKKEANFEDLVVYSFKRVK